MPSHSDHSPSHHRPEARDPDLAVPADPEEEAPGAQGGAEMSFLDHLEELRVTIMRVLAVFILGIVVVAIFIKPFETFLRQPVLAAFERMEVQQEKLYVTEVFGIFNVLLQLAFLGALSLTLPALLFFSGKFVAPALTRNEARVLVPGSFFAFILFLGGCLFAYFFVLPAALTVSIRMNQFFGYELFWTATRYYSMLFGLLLLMGAAFQFPLVIVMLVYIGAVTSRQLREWRRIAFVIILIVSALITPTGDPVTLFILCAPLYTLYELAIVVGAAIERWQRNQLAAEEP